MVKAAALDAGLELERVHVIPFPGQRAGALARPTCPRTSPSSSGSSPTGAARSSTGCATAGYEVVVLDEGVEKEISGAEVRLAIREGGGWEAMVPPGVAAVLRGLEPSLV